MDHAGRHAAGRYYLSPIIWETIFHCDEKNKTEVVDKKEINTAIKPIVNTGNTLRTVGTKNFLMMVPVLT